VTAAECHSQGRLLIRCRLRPVWSLVAKVAFSASLSAQLLVIGVLGRENPWLWAMLLSMGIVVWLLHEQERDLQRIISKFLDDTAKKIGLVKLDASPPEPAPPPTAKAA
jgi:hypothetical protein